jgi:hypothetical protein
LLLGGQFPRIGSLIRFGLFAGVAQLVERFTCNEDVGGSNPLAGSMFLKGFLFSENPFFMDMAH